MTAKPSRIVRLEAENVKRLKAVAIEPDGSVVVISGKNGQGKTSVLDAIMMCLGGKKAIPRRPVRDGADEATIRIELDGDVVIERRIKPDGQTVLAVMNRDGAKYSSPQTIIDGLVGNGLAFDPFSFTRMGPKEQRDLLARIAGLDTRDLEAERERIFNERTVVNREVKRLEGEISGVPHHANAPAEEVSVADLAEQLRVAEQHQLSIARAEADAAKAAAELAAANETAETVRREIAEVEAKLATLRERLERGEKSVIPTREAALDVFRERVEALRSSAPDRDEISKALAGVEHLNRDVRDNRRREELKGTHKSVDTKAHALTAKISELDAAKSKRIAEASYPLPGLTVDDAGVVLHGLPFESASSAEQLRVSVAIGLALNPGLRVLLVRDGSLLDTDSLRLLRDLASQADAQVWLEAVGEREASIVIEDGAVVAKPAPEARP